MTYHPTPLSHQNNRSLSIDSTHYNTSPLQFCPCTRNVRSRCPCVRCLLHLPETGAEARLQLSNPCKCIPSLKPRGSHLHRGAHCCLPPSLPHHDLSPRQQQWSGDWLRDLRRRRDMVPHLHSRPYLLVRTVTRSSHQTQLDGRRAG